MKQIALAVALAAASATAGPPALAQQAPKLVTVVTSHEPQVQLMAMVLTMQVAQQDADVHIMLCDQAGDIALREAPESATAGQPPRDASPQGLLQAIQSEAGATVEVCAIYLPGKGMDESALLDGITAANPAEMAARLMAPTARVLSF